MNKNTGDCIGIQTLSPLTGTAVPLEDVPDPVLSQKIIGGGIAVLPRDGRLVSPVDEEVVSTTDTLRVYDLRLDEGTEVMVHFGFETVSLKGGFFACHVRPGDKAKIGDLLTEADLKGLEKGQVNTITSVLIYEDMEGCSMSATPGLITAGKDAVITLLDQCLPEAESS